MTSKEIFERVIKNGMVSGNVPLNLVSEAEKKLGVIFPNQYIEFLKEYGAIMLNGCEIFGIISTDWEKSDETPLFSSVVNETEIYRKKNSFFAENLSYIPISSDGYSKVFFLDTNLSPKTCIKSFDFGQEICASKDIYEFCLNFDSICDFYF